MLLLYFCFGCNCETFQLMRYTNWGHFGIHCGLCHVAECVSLARNIWLVTWKQFNTFLLSSSVEILIVHCMDSNSNEPESKQQIIRSTCKFDQSNVCWVRLNKRFRRMYIDLCLSEKLVERKQLTWFQIIITPHIRHAKQYQYNKSSLWYKHGDSFCSANTSIPQFIRYCNSCLILFFFVCSVTFFFLCTTNSMIHSFKFVNLFYFFHSIVWFIVHIYTKSLRICI